MGNSDSSQYTLRYNEITQELEAAIGNTWEPVTITNPGAGITQLTGDVTAGPGSGSQAATLATVNANVGSFTNTNLTVDAKGRITAASNGSSSAISQVVSHTDTTQVTTVSPDTYVATNTSASITMASATHKLKITISGNIDNQGYFTVFQDGITNLGGGAIFDGNIVLGIQSNAADQVCPFAFVITPGDTSSHTYTVYVAAIAGNITWPSHGLASIILEEIVA